MVGSVVEVVGGGGGWRIEVEVVAHLWVEVVAVWGCGSVGLWQEAHLFVEPVLLHQSQALLSMLGTRGTALYRVFLLTGHP